MENKKTLKFITSANVAVIACTKDKGLQFFLKYIATENGKPIAECTIDEIDKIDLSALATKIVIVRGLLHWYDAQKLIAMNDIAKAHDVHFIVPLEKLDCDHYVAMAQLSGMSGMLMFIPQSDHAEIQIFRLYFRHSPVSLRCEFGENEGQYLIYDNNEGKFEETSYVLEKKLNELYHNWNEELKSKCPELLSENFSNPHYVYIPAGWATAKNRVMIVGEEGYGIWGQGKQAGLTCGDIADIQRANGEIVDYILAKDNDSRKFWRRFKSISDFGVHCIWNNLDKIYYMGKDRKKCCLTAEEESLLHSTNIKILKEEIAILKPTVVVFFGWYRNALRMELPEIWEKLYPNGDDSLWKNSFYKIFDNDITYIFTYHPSWHGKYKPADYEQRVIDCIAGCLK